MSERPESQETHLSRNPVTRFVHGSHGRPILGIDKGNDYADLVDLARDKVKALICLGKDNEKLHRAFGDHIETVIDASSMEEAVQQAYYLADKGETVLLSPACASFDLFENFEERGWKFKEAVRKL